MDLFTGIEKNEYPDINFDELTANEYNAFDDVEDALRNASAIGNATQAGIQTASLQSVIDNYAQNLNQSAITKAGTPTNLASIRYKGFVAEEYFKHTLKINALSEGIPDWQVGIYTKGTLPDGSTLSGIDKETDITIFTRKRPWSRSNRSVDYQSKMYQDPKNYTKLQNNPQYRNVELVGAADNNIVDDAIKIKIGKKTIVSDTISNEDAMSLADSMKAQDTPKYGKAVEKHAELNKVNMGKAVAAGAATGLILSTVKEIVEVIKNSDNLPEDQFVQSISNILYGTAEGGIRGGAIMGSVQLFGKIVGKEIAANSFGAVPIMAVANTAVDFAKDLYRCFVAETIDIDDLLCNTINNAFSSLAGFGGGYLGGYVGGYIGVQIAGFTSAQAAAATGAAIGSPLGPIGTVIGSVVGGIVIGIGANAIVGTANKDAQKEFEKCIEEFNSHIELNGCQRLYYFTDSMSSISEFRLSFKNLLPCYNLISDLREYNLHKKAINSIHEQLDASIASIEASRISALQKIEEQHRLHLKELQDRFKEQRDIMFTEYRDSLNTYVVNSYSQYLGIYDVLSGNVESLKARLNETVISHNAILDYSRNRIQVNAQLNETLAEIMSDEDSVNFMKPFVEKMKCFMQQDEMMVGRQYLSQDEARFLVSGGKYE